MISTISIGVVDEPFTFDLFQILDGRMQSVTGNAEYGIQAVRRGVGNKVNPQNLVESDFTPGKGLGLSLIVIHVLVLRFLCGWQSQDCELPGAKNRRTSGRIISPKGVLFSALPADMRMSGHKNTANLTGAEAGFCKSVFSTCSQPTAYDDGCQVRFSRGGR